MVFPASRRGDVPLQCLLLLRPHCLQQAYASWWSCENEKVAIGTDPFQLNTRRKPQHASSRKPPQSTTVCCIVHTDRIQQSKWGPLCCWNWWGSCEECPLRPTISTLQVLTLLRPSLSPSQLETLPVRILTGTTIVSAEVILLSITSIVITLQTLKKKVTKKLQSDANLTYLKWFGNFCHVCQKSSFHLLLS